MSDSRAIRKRKSAAALAMWLSRPGLCGLIFAVCPRGFAFAVQLSPFSRRRFTTAVWPHGLWPRSAEKPPATRAARGFFRSWFDSSQARKTVRWRHFRGLLFAPENRAKNARPCRAGALRSCKYPAGSQQTVRPTPAAALLSFCGQTLNRLQAARLPAPAPRQSAPISLLIQ